MGSMCGAFPTKRARTSGSETHVGSENDAVSKNAVVSKHCVSRKNDALESNDVGQNAATASQPTHRRAKPNGPNAGLRYVVAQRVWIVGWLQQNPAFSIANRNPSH